MSLRPRLVRHCRPSMTQLFEQQPSLYSPSPTPGASTIMSDQKSEDYCSNSSVLTEKAELGVGGGDSSGDDRTFDEAVFDLLKVNAEEIARQITLLDLQLFKAIQPDELTSCAWSQPKYKNERAYNIVQSTRRFNHINFWVQREILREKDIQKRAQVLAQFIKICRKLVDMNNLQSAMSILAALQSAAIHRLERTWAALTKHQRAAYEKVSELFSEANNRQRLRDHMKTVKLPAIPYLGLYLSDLTYIDVAHPSTGGIESQARQDKMNNILRVIADFQQQSSYPFIRREHIRKYILGQQYIEELQKFVEDGNFKLSKELEPPADTSPPVGLNGGGAAETLVTSLKPSHLVDPAGGRGASMMSCASGRGLGLSGPLTSTPGTCRVGQSTPEALLSVNLALSTGSGTSNVELRPQRLHQPPKSHRKSKSLDNKDLFGSLSDLSPGLSGCLTTSARPQLLRHPLDDSLLVGQTPPAIPRFQLHAAAAAAAALSPATGGQPLSPQPGQTAAPHTGLILDSKHLRSCGIDGPAACADLTPSPDSNGPVDAMVPAIAGSVDLDKASVSMSSIEGLVNGRGMAGLMSVSTGSGAATSASSAVVVDTDVLLPSEAGLLYPGETMPEALDTRPTICEGCLKRKTLMKFGKRKSPWKMWRRLWVRLVEYESLFYLLYYRPRRSFSYGTDRDEFRREVHAAQCLRKTLVSMEGEDILGPSSGISSSPGSAGPGSPNPSPARASSFSARHRFSIPFSHGRHHQLTLKMNDLLRQNSHSFRKVGRGGVSLDDWHNQLSRSIREMEDAIERRDLIQLHDS